MPQIVVFQSTYLIMLLPVSFLFHFQLINLQDFGSTGAVYIKLCSNSMSVCDCIFCITVVTSWMYLYVCCFSVSIASLFLVVGSILVRVTRFLPNSSSTLVEAVWLSCAIPSSTISLWVVLISKASALSYIHVGSFLWCFFYFIPYLFDRVLYEDRFAGLSYRRLLPRSCCSGLLEYRLLLVFTIINPNQIHWFPIRQTTMHL